MPGYQLPTGTVIIDALEWRLMSVRPWIEEREQGHPGEASRAADQLVQCPGVGSF